MRRLLIRVILLSLIFPGYLLFHELFSRWSQLPKANRLIIVVNNRVPRCGSTLVRTIFEDLSNKRNAFTYIHNDSHTARHRLSEEEQTGLRNGLLTAVRKSEYKRILFVRHVHFVPFEPAKGVSFYYINQIRDPIARSLSNFDYKRYRCTLEDRNRPCRKLDPSLANLTMEQCLRRGDPRRCVSKRYGVQSAVSYFCGQSHVCDDTLASPVSEAALSLAKSNIEKYYTYVGLLEYIADSLKLLEHTLPDVFSGLSDAYRDQVRILARVNVVPDRNRVQISNESRTILRRLLTNEYALYEFIKARFIRKYRKVFHREPVYEYRDTN